MQVMEIVALSALRDNYIWLIREGSRCVVVDPGDAQHVLDYLEQHSLTLAAILLTHRHADHQAGVSALHDEHPSPIYGPESAAMRCVSAPLYPPQMLGIEGFSQPICVIACPGHTEEHIAYYWQDALFCGDTLFAGGCGRLLGGSAQQLFASLHTFAALPADTRIFCSHEYTLSNLAFAKAAEPDNAAIQARYATCAQRRQANLPTLPSRLGEELATNPFLRSHLASLKKSAEIKTGHVLHDPLAVFTALRYWKDEF